MEHSALKDKSDLSTHSTLRGPTATQQQPTHAAVAREGLLVHDFECIATFRLSTFESGARWRVAFE